MTRSLETVAAPSGRVATLVSHSTLPVARLSASISPASGLGLCGACFSARVGTLAGRRYEPAGDEMGGRRGRSPAAVTDDRYGSKYRSLGLLRMVAEADCGETSATG
jgi:hypothetical protein